MSEHEILQHPTPEMTLHADSGSNELSDRAEPTVLLLQHYDVSLLTKRAGVWLSDRRSIVSHSKQSAVT